MALTCDTTGTLIASHYVNPKTRIACIFGTGCNAAYMERVGNIPKIASLGIDPDAQMAINCEWVSRRHSHHGVLVLISTPGSIRLVRARESAQNEV